jgi:hypothetical protein
MNGPTNHDDIKLIPIKDAILVPRYLLEQVKDLTFEVDNFYSDYDALYSRSPYSLLYLVADRSRELPIIGVLWVTIEPLARCMHGNLVSLNREYQGNGVFRDVVLPTVFDIAKKCKLRKIYWHTTRTKAYKRMNPEFKESAQVLMETEVDNG